MVVTDPKSKVILREMKRLLKVIRSDKDAPEGAHEITALIVDMLASLLMGEMTIRAFMNVLESRKDLFKDVIVYYAEFFIVVEKLTPA